MVFNQRIDLSCLCNTNDSLQTFGSVVIEKITHLRKFTYTLFRKVGAEAKMVSTIHVVNDSGR